MLKDEITFNNIELEILKNATSWKGNLNQIIKLFYNKLEENDKNTTKFDQINEEEKDKKDFINHKRFRSDVVSEDPNFKNKITNNFFEDEDFKNTKTEFLNRVDSSILPFDNKKKVNFFHYS